MPGDIEPLLTLSVGAVVVLFFGYAAYWGIRTKGVLLDGLYRSQALWVSAVAVVFAMVVVANLVIGELAPTNWYLSLLQFGLEYAGAALTFASIDTTIRVGIRSDPLARDTLRWKTLRKILWAVTILTIAGGLAQVLILRTNFYTSPGGPQGVIIYGPFGNLFALVALVLARSRSKDYILRRHMKWFSFFVLDLLVASGDPLYRYTGAHLLLSALLLFGGLFLYLASKSLVAIGGTTRSLESPTVQRPLPSVPSRRQTNPVN